MTPDHLTGLILENSHPPLLCYEPLAGQEQRYAPVRNCTMPVCAFWIGMVSASGQRLVPTEDEEDDSMAWVISQVIVNAEDLLGSIRVAVFGYYDAERFDPGARAVVGSDRRGPVSRPASVGFTAGVVVSADAIVHLTEYRDALTFYLFCGAIGPIEAAAFCPSSAAPPAEPVSGMGSGVGLTPCEDLGWEALCSGVPAEAVAVIRWSGAYYHVPILGVRSDLGFTPADLFRPRLGPQCRLAKGDYLHFTRASNSWMLNGRPVVETTPLLAPARIPRGRGLD